MSKELNSEDIFADPMLDSDEYLEEYIEQLKQLLKENKLPDLERKMKYKVYSIRGRDFGAHKSIVLTTNDKDFFTVELGFITVNGKKRIYPVTRALDSSRKAGLTYHGEITTTGGSLISNAIAAMKNFGSYFKLCNNCQDFCNIYLGLIGLPGEKAMTDGDKATLLAMAAGILVILFALLRK